jgi:hypothetical protein
LRRSLRNGLRRILDLANAGEDPVDLLVEPHPTLGRRQATLQAVEQLEARIRLKMRDELAHGRLRDVEQIGCVADAAVFDHGLESLDLAKRESTRHCTTLVNGPTSQFATARKQSGGTRAPAGRLFS